MQRYKRWLAGLSKGQRVRYRLLQGATIVSTLVIVFFLGLRAWIQVPDLPVVEPDNDVQTDSGGISFDGAQTPNIAHSGRKEGVYTFLLVGKDTAGGGNTDTVLLITYNTKEKTINGLSLPRDTMMNVSSASKRLSAVYNNNRGKDKATQVEQGVAALKKEVAHLTGITPDFYILVEWDAIGALVDALGGVEFEVPFDMNYDDPTPGQNLHIHQAAGLRLLTGDDAMQVIRHRKNNDGSHSNGDIGRLKIQQDFLKAVAKKCLQPATFLKVPALAQIFTENVTTDLTLGNILAFAELAYGMDAEGGVSFATAPIGASFSYRGAAMITLDEAGLLDLLNETMNPYLREIRSADLQLVYRKGNGTFGVTNAALADERMGQVQVTAPAADTQEEDEQTGDESRDPSQDGDGSSQDGSNTQHPGGADAGGNSAADDNGQTGQGGVNVDVEEGSFAQEDSLIGGIDPDQVLPDPRENVILTQPEQPDETSNFLAVLPGWPSPFEQVS